MVAKDPIDHLNHVSYSSNRSPYWNIINSYYLAKVELVTINMYLYYSAKQKNIILILVLHLSLITAYGFSKCSLVYNNTEYVDCVSNGVVNLTTTIQYLPAKTKWLNVSQNEITMVQNRAFSHLPNLLELRLGRNKINFIERNAFMSLRKLYFLDLKYNFIQFLDTLDFSNLTSLKILHISHNKICTLGSIPLRPLRVLKELDLSSNCISDFRMVAEAVKDLPVFLKLNMSYNTITELDNNQSLLKLPTLEYLNLCNNSISEFDLTFYFLPKLTELSLMRNKMTRVNGSSFCNAPMLINVSFDENPLNISQLVGSPLHNLNELHWSSMRPALQHDLLPACQLFKTLPKLQLLDIKHSKIPKTNLQIIGRCTNLTSLYLSTTALDQLQHNELQTFKNLEVLYLDKCKITKISNKTWTGLVALHTLILERNRISFLKDFLFSPLINLQTLDLSKNYLTVINKYAFYHLHKLKYLSLKSCNIGFITRDTFTYLWPLKFLDMRDNSISFIKRSTFQKLTRLETLLLSGNKILTIQKSGLDGLKSVKYLSLSNNVIYKITKDTFKLLKSLVSLDLSNNQLWSFNKFQSPNPFVHLKLLETLDLSYQVQKDVIIVPLAMFDGLQSLKSLNVKGNPSLFFKNVSFSKLSNLTYLDMSKVYTSKGGPLPIRPELFGSLTQLRTLVLDNTEIRDLPEDIFENLTLLENLSLRYNRLRNISKTLLQSMTSLTYFDVYRNPLSCSCENYWFQNWSESNPRVQVPFIQSYSCFGQVASDINFLQQDLSFCGTDISMYFFIGSFVTTLLFITINLLLVKLKWTIQYGYYMLRVWCKWQTKKEDKLYIYDAFISYCSDDERWVIENMLSQLEEHGQRKYKLCFKPRDFIPGIYHIDNIQNAISNSRKTLCVVSRKYLESDWCRTEVQMACSRIFYHNEDVLLMVFLEEIPDYRLSAYHKLRKLIKQNMYISWPEDPQGEDLFWFKLRKALDTGIYEEDAVQLTLTN
ncbi:uncharacterized protein O3C94_014528 [Discoglossus pictus]